MSAPAAVLRSFGPAISLMATSTSMAAIEPEDSGCWSLPEKARAPDLPVVTVVAVALLDADNRVLLAQRPEGKHLAGYWEFPGGKMEAGETPEAALTRELKEELGIDIRESCLAPLSFVSHSYEKFHLLM